MDSKPQMTVAVINRKGGTGKSTVTVNLAGELALRGYNVGVVDTDGQPGNASLYYGMPREDGLFQALVGVQQGDYYYPVPLIDIIRDVPWDSFGRAGITLEPGRLLLLPSGDNTFRIPFLLDDVDRFSDMTADFIETWELDFLLIDTAPTMSMFDGSVYSAADGFLYVTECEIGALAGLESAFQQVERQQRRRKRSGLRPSLIMGIVPNKVRSLREHIDNINDLAQAFPGLVWPQLRLLKTYAKSNKYGQTVRALNANGPEAYEIDLMVDRFLEAAQSWALESVR